MTQLDLLSGVSFVPWNPQHLARTSNPETSTEAAKSTQTLVQQHHVLILGALMQGPGGCDQIAARAGLQPHAVGKRLGELEKAGAIRLTGATVPSNSGRAQRVWERVSKN